MNRRDFVTRMGGAAAAASILNGNSLLAASTPTTPLYVKGLVMVSFEDPQILRLGFPSAPGHRGTLALVPQKGSKRNLTVKGTATIEGATVGSTDSSRFAIPELVRMKEFYGEAIRSRISECPTVISIPYTTIKSITAAELSPTKYTFIRRDTGAEVTTFRVRKIAESIRIDLASDGAIHISGGKTPIMLNDMRELHAEFAPENPPTNSSIDPFAAHFGHYFTYLDRPQNANFDVVPQKVTNTNATPPRVGNSFAAFLPFYTCFLVRIP